MNVDMKLMKKENLSSIIKVKLIIQVNWKKIMPTYSLTSDTKRMLISREIGIVANNRL